LKFEMHADDLPNKLIPLALQGHTVLQIHVDEGLELFFELHRIMAQSASVFQQICRVVCTHLSTRCHTIVRGVQRQACVPHLLKIRPAFSGTSTVRADSAMAISSVKGFRGHRINAHSRILHARDEDIVCRIAVMVSADCPPVPLQETRITHLNTPSTTS
jgi:hypothetical protein